MLLWVKRVSLRDAATSDLYVLDFGSELNMSSSPQLIAEGVVDVDWSRG